MGTATIQNYAYELFVSPYHHGIANIQNSWRRNVTVIHASDEIEHCELLLWDVAERIMSLAVGLFLLIPLINTALYSVLTLFESHFVHPLHLRGTPAPLWYLLSPSEPGVSGLDHTYNVTRDHLEAAVATYENIPEPPLEVRNTQGEMKRVETVGLRSFFPRLNFTNPQLAGYRNPARVEDDGWVIAYDRVLLNTEIQRRVNVIIDRIENRTQFTAVPYDSSEREAYYQKLEKMIKHIVKCLHEEEDPDVINSVIIDLACMSTHCGGRYMGEIQRLYAFLKNREDGFTDQTIQGKIQTKLTSVRKQIFLRLIGEREGESWMRSAMSPHVHNYYLHRIGPDLGLPGSNVEYNDSCHGYQTIFPHNKRALVQRFHELYNPTTIHSNILEIFNCRENDTDPNAVHRDVALQWFKDQFTAPNPPAFARDYILEHRARIVAEHAQDFAEDQAARADAIRERDEIDQRINQLPQNQRIKARELIGIKSGTRAYLQTLQANERGDLLDLYGVPQNIRQNEERVEEYLSLSAQLALTLPVQIMRNAHMQALGMNPEELASFRRDVLQYAFVSGQINRPQMSQQLSEADILVHISDDYRARKLLEDLGEGRGQRIRPEAVVDCLTALGIFQER